MADFNYRGVRVEDTWSSAASTRGSQSRFNARRRQEGGERWRAELEDGRAVECFTRAEVMTAIRAIRAETHRD